MYDDATPPDQELWRINPEISTLQGRGKTNVYNCMDHPDIHSIIVTKTPDVIFMDVIYPSGSSIPETLLESGAFEEGVTEGGFGRIGTGSTIHGITATKEAIQNAVTFIDGITPIPDAIKEQISQTVASVKPQIQSAVDISDILETALAGEGTGRTNTERAGGFRERIQKEQAKISNEAEPRQP